MIVQRRVSIFMQPSSTSLAPTPATAERHPRRGSQAARQSRSRPRLRRAQSKIKGRGTSLRQEAGLHVGWCGTPILRWRAANNAKAAPALQNLRADFSRLGATSPERAS
jgi:hypothetical protein